MKTIQVSKAKKDDTIMLGGCWHKVIAPMQTGVWTIREWDGKEVFIKAPCAVLKAE